MTSNSVGVGASPKALVCRGIYYGVQALRGSVTPDLVRRAQRLLDSSAEGLWGHVRDGLRRSHGALDPPLTWLEGQPLTDRRAVAELLRARDPQPWESNRIEWKRTSGSTGSPVRIPRDMTMAAWIDATMWALYSWHGIKPGDPHARFWGVPLDGRPPLRSWLRDRALNRIGVDAFTMDAGWAREQFERMRKARIRYIHGYPSAISHFVDLLTDQGLEGRDLGVHVVFSTGELLAPNVRQRIAGFLECRVVNEYGCAESGLLGFECESGQMHLVPLTALPEVVDEAGVRVTTPRETGEVVITDVVGTAFPLLRYRLRDRATGVSPASCNCGRELPLCGLAEGRVGSLIRLPDGRAIYSAFLSYSMPEGVRRFQADQPTIDKLRIRVVPDPCASWSRIRDTLEESLRLRIPISVRLEIIEVEEDAIPLDGKLRYFVPLQN